jgi:hypothetical protein
VLNNIKNREKSSKKEHKDKDKSSRSSSSNKSKSSDKEKSNSSTSSDKATAAAAAAAVANDDKPARPEVTEAEARRVAKAAIEEFAVSTMQYSCCQCYNAMYTVQCTLQTVLLYRTAMHCTVARRCKLLLQACCLLLRTVCSQLCRCCKFVLK